MLVLNLLPKLAKLAMENFYNQPIRTARLRVSTDALAWLDGKVREGLDGKRTY
jgi:hypothetical protein